MKQVQGATSTTTVSSPNVLVAATFVLTFLLLSATHTVTAQLEGCTAEQLHPDALTNTLGLGPIPQTCIPAPQDATSNVPRCYHTYVPPCAAASDTPVPLVMDIHGLGSCPLASAAYTGWANKATQECVVVVWPLGTVDTNVTQVPCFAVPGGTPSAADGTDVSSDCCCYKGVAPVAPAETQDLTVLRRMVLDVVATAPTVHNVTIDATRIYMAGHSNGCMASMAMAALHSDIVAAVCCHAGAVVTPVPDDNGDYSPVPIWRVHGVMDKTIPYAGGLVLGFQRFLSAQRGLDYMGDANGCDDNIVTTVVTGGTRMQRVNCTNGATVELLSLDASGHSPYADAIEYDAGVADTELDTTTFAWEFCSSFSKPEVPQAFTNAPTMAPSVESTDSPTLSSSASSTMRGYGTTFQALATLVSAGLFAAFTLLP